MKRLFCGAVLAFAISVPELLAQANDGNLLGAVTDATGAAIPNANVQLENSATGVKASAKTDFAGLYRFNNVLIGNYNVTFSVEGFRTTQLRNVTIELNKNTTANVVLEPGTVVSQVEVTEAFALIDTTTARRRAVAPQQQEGW
jgi:Carboxypeptidase regulatory-like domain